MDLVFVGPVLVAAIVSLLIVSSVRSSQTYVLIYSQDLHAR